MCVCVHVALCLAAQCWVVCSRDPRVLRSLIERFILLRISVFCMCADGTNHLLLAALLSVCVCVCVCACVCVYVVG